MKNTFSRSLLFPPSLIVLVFVAFAPLVNAQSGELTPRDIIQGAMDNFRGSSSYTEMTMTIHREDWERSISMHAWTSGEKNSLVRVTKPKKDLGNATLIKDKEMWSFAPKINRVIKVPSSMMNQSWMGSDFSNKDVSRADDIIDQYTHRLVEIRGEPPERVYVIEAIPREDAAVVWGRELLDIREDYVVLAHRFFDQDDELVKELESLQVGEMGGRNVAIVQRMQKVDSEEEWTEIRLDDVSYDVELSESLFTLSNLRNPRN